jgi:hypothetical protein
VKTRSLSHHSDQALLRELAAALARDHDTTATLLALLAEVDARRLYLPAGYPSMFLFCVHEFHMSEDVALKRIRAARTARRFPAIVEAVVEGQLNLSGVVMLPPHLTAETVDELLAATTHKTNAEIELLLAERFPRPDVPTQVQSVAKTLPACQLAARPVGMAAEQLAARPVEEALKGLEASTPRPRVVPLSPERFALQLTIGRSTRDKLRYAQALLSHQVSSGDVAEVLDRALDALILTLEKRKFAATAKPRARQRHSTAHRHIPAEVKRTVWERDRGQCTFVSEAGHRCPARARLEFDHIDPVARGGRATAERTRLRCRAHNQYEAERVFGTEFMSEKRRSARRAAAQRRTAAAAARARAEATAATERALERDVVPWLRQLGYSVDEARRAAAFCETMSDAPLDERVRAALSFLGRKVRHTACAPRWSGQTTTIHPAPGPG